MVDQIIENNVEDEGVETRVYELGYHLVPSFTEEELPAEVAAVRARIEAHGGIFIADEFPRSTALTYTIFRSSGGKRERFSSSYFGWFKFEMDPGEAAKLKEELRTERRIIRFIVVKTVRENTIVPKRLLTTEKEENDALRKKEISAPREAEKSTGSPVSDEELDKTIEGLVVQ